MVKPINNKKYYQVPIDYSTLTPLELCQELIKIVNQFSMSLSTDSLQVYAKLLEQYNRLVSYQKGY